MTTATRRSGVLLHPTSLPGSFGIGDLGPSASRFIDQLVDMGQSLWQILPLTPTTVGDSPYFSPSAFAGNPLLLSPEILFEEGWLEKEIESFDFPSMRVDFGKVVSFKAELLAQAFESFEEKAMEEDSQAFGDFSAREASWLDDYALFMAIKEAHGGKPWTEWEEKYSKRNPQALDEAQKLFFDRIKLHRFGQFLFRKQWKALKEYANSKGIEVIGDMPIFVAHDSADVWAHPEFWRLDEKGYPVAVAGVPPDYFSETGQLWGNPLYDWEALEKADFSWWVERFRSLLELVDWIRVDHFRGFAGFWEIPAGEETAIHGRWVAGPGKKLFHSLQEKLGKLPVLAEDLGVLTPDVIELRDHFGFPGMKILQFAFDCEEENNYFPHLYPENCVVYTGTHDNDTTLGWYKKADSPSKKLFKEYIGKCEMEEPNWDLIRLGHASVAEKSIVPLQDLLSLGTKARLNTPGTLGGNWGWRFEEGELKEEIVERFLRMTKLYNRKD